MILYRVAYEDSGVQRGYDWTGSKADANKRAAAWRRLGPSEGDGPMEASVQRIETGTRRPAILALLNEYAAHPDNG